MSGLLQRNREGTLDADGQRGLDEMMRLYEHGLRRKSQDLEVAVQRGLREPLRAWAVQKSGKQRRGSGFAWKQEIGAFTASARSTW